MSIPRIGVGVGGTCNTGKDHGRNHKTTPHDIITRTPQTVTASRSHHHKHSTTGTTPLSHHHETNTARTSPREQYHMSSTHTPQQTRHVNITTHNHTTRTPRTQQGITPRSHHSHMTTITVSRAHHHEHSINDSHITQLTQKNIGSH